MQSEPSPHNETDARKHRRFAVRFRSSFSSRHMIGGEGVVTDLSLGGCRITGQGTVPPGTMLEMRFALPGQSLPLEVGLATVRWAKGSEFGVEFLQVRKDVEERLRQLLATLEEEQGSQELGSPQ